MKQIKCDQCGAVERRAIVTIKGLKNHSGGTERRADLCSQVCAIEWLRCTLPNKAFDKPLPIL